MSNIYICIYIIPQATPAHPPRPVVPADGIDLGDRSIQRCSATVAAPLGRSDLPLPAVVPWR